MRLYPQACHEVSCPPGRQWGHVGLLCPGPPRCRCLVKTQRQTASGLPGCLPQGMPSSPPVFAPPPAPPAADLWLTAGTDLAILLHPLTRLPEEEGTASLSLCRATPVRTSLPP